MLESHFSTRILVSKIVPLFHIDFTFCMTGRLGFSPVSKCYFIGLLIGLSHDMSVMNVGLARS